MYRLGGRDDVGAEVGSLQVAGVFAQVTVEARRRREKSMPCTQAAKLLWCAGARAGSRRDGGVAGGQQSGLGKLLCRVLPGEL